LLEYLLEIGPADATGMGAVPISFQEIESWQHQVGVELAPWEVRMLRSLSREYVGELNAATKPDRPMPWEPGKQQTIQAAANNLRAAVRAMAGL
jgi:hypothetical protein